MASPEKIRPILHKIAAADREKHIDKIILHNYSIPCPAMRFFRSKKTESI
jgi:hypothetical protein